MDEQMKEQFERWADDHGMCLDEVFMSTDGVPDNPYEERNTHLAFLIWSSAWESAIAARQSEGRDDG